MTEPLLVINAGSSSLKFQIYDVGRDNVPGLRCGGQISGIGSQAPTFNVNTATGNPLFQQTLSQPAVHTLLQAQDTLAAWLAQQLESEPCAVGHRIVHGGAAFNGPVRIDGAVLDQLDALTPLAPLHQRNNLEPVHVIRQRWPHIPQVACFDTAFHRSHSPLVDRFALPASYFDQGVRRYGFHGLSYEYIAGRLRETMPDIARGRVVVAHLGSGASACALLDGRSVETTMGFTALDGLPMGTRPGSLDPGVVLWMAQQGMSTDEIQHVLYYESGLKGLSGISGDIRELLASPSVQAQMALEYYAYRTATCLASLLVSLQGLDALVFTAGVGQYAAPVRMAICQHLQWLGIRLDQGRNQRHALCISSDDSAIPVFVMATNEEWIIANQTLTCLGRQAGTN